MNSGYSLRESGRSPLAWSGGAMQAKRGRRRQQLHALITSSLILAAVSSARRWVTPTNPRVLRS
jgi:hypothetical protein